MRHHHLPLLAALLLLLGSSCNAFKKASSSSAPAPAEYSTKSGAEAQTEYIQKFNRAAVMEMARGGVPASIILAQGLLESAAGQSELARSANNHFGVKCSSGWKGQVYMKKDDDRDKDGNIIESCFRKYNDVAESYYDHGEFLRDPKKANRYGFLFNLDRTDYKSWARGLQSAGYATSADYADRLINLIERYRLYEYDSNKAPIDQPVRPSSPTPGGAPQSTPGSTASTGPQLPPLQRIGRVNDVKVVLSKPGESLDEIARLYRLNVGKVVDYNERHYPPGFKLRENTRIYIQEKRSKWHGRAAEHFVQEGQTMFDISQQYGVCLEKLLSRNHLRPNEEPAIGEKIWLKGTRKKSDMLRLRDTSKDPKPEGQPIKDNTP
ncbi:MAG TPA: glucosaminidase domain-containing protein, partial [Saprospiraceae bacterium]|nr:glucosaminidase domain-containing protein [Saprospiraceae bacterium]